MLSGCRTLESSTVPCSESVDVLLAQPHTRVIPSSMFRVWGCSACQMLQVNALHQHVHKKVNASAILSMFKIGVRLIACYVCRFTQHNVQCKEMSVHRLVHARTLIENVCMLSDSHVVDTHAATTSDSGDSGCAMNAKICNKFVWLQCSCEGESV